ncbi:hypothetical protein CRG98_029479 [Punica granatum]|uniref:Uncharacterized protein n=1 Tax=Punica granatum TaxID=22663 RepID=A0A2I0J1P8_PUNGR|nr:hypothetical protein CRG98_029479 [Punica granatum]
MAAPCDKSFSNSYLLLRPEDVGLVDLFRILFSTNLEQRKFVDSSHDTEESFNQRWIIFISIIVQKLLLSMAKPMAWVGSTIELWLNLMEFFGFYDFWNGKNKVLGRFLSYMENDEGG